MCLLILSSVVLGDEIDASVEIDDAQEDDVSYFILFVLLLILFEL